MGTLALRLGLCWILGEAEVGSPTNGRESFKVQKLMRDLACSILDQHKGATATTVGRAGEERFFLLVYLHQRPAVGGPIDTSYC